jgi:hypothetical protein
MDSLDECKFDASITAPPWGELGRAFTLGVISGYGKLMLQVLNRTTVVNHERWIKTVMERSPGEGLITISNHTRCDACGRVHNACATHTEMRACKHGRWAH